MTTFTFVAVALLMGCGAGDTGTNVAEADAVSLREYALEFSSRIPDFGVETAAVNRRPGVIAGYNAILLNERVALVANYDHVLMHDFLNGTSKAIGRRGDGPGEFGQLSNIFHSDTGFATADNNRREAILFRPTGEFVRSVSVRAGTTVGWLKGYGPAGRRGGLEFPLTYARQDSSGEPAKELIQFPILPDLHIAIIENGGTSHNYLSPACDPTPIDATVGDRLYVTNQKRGEVIVVDPDGSSRVIFRSPRKGMITVAVVEMIKRSYRHARPADVEALLKRFGDVGDSLYVTWDRMIPDPNGRLWLRFSACVNDGERIWDVIDTSGARQGTLQTNRHIIAAWGNYLLVRGEDSLGTPELSRWRTVQRR